MSFESVKTSRSRIQLNVLGEANALSERAKVLSQQVLLVDSDVATLDSMRTLFERAGLGVTLATDGKSALRLLEGHPPALVVSELHLPEMDGPSLCQAAHSFQGAARVPFIFLSRQVSLAEKIRALKAGGVAVLSKPLAGKTLMEQVQVYLRAPRAVSKTPVAFVQHLEEQGSLSEVSWVQLLEKFQKEGRSGCVRVSGSSPGGLSFEEGRLIDATYGSLQGPRAFYRLFRLQDANYSIVWEIDSSRRVTVRESHEELLHEAQAQAAAWNALCASLPPLSSIWEVNARALGQGKAVFDEHDYELLLSFDGVKTVQDIVDASSDDVQCLELVAKLLSQGLIQLVQGPAQFLEHALDPSFEIAQMNQPTPLSEEPTAESEGEPASGAVEITLEEEEVESRPLHLAPAHLLNEWADVEEAVSDKSTAPNPISASVFFSESEHAEVPLNSRRVRSASLQKTSTSDDQEVVLFKKLRRRQRMSVVTALMVVAFVTLGLLYWLAKSAKPQASTNVPHQEPVPLAVKPVVVPTDNGAPITSPVPMQEAAPAAAVVEVPTIELILMAGNRELTARRFNKALPLFREALRRDADSPEAQAGLGMTLVYGGSERDAKEAISLLSLSLEKKPKNPKAWRALGVAYQNSGELEKAWNAYREFLRLAPNDKDAEETRNVLRTNHQETE